MAEKRQHLQLVEVAYDYISGIVPNNYLCLIEKDSPDTSRPSSTGTFIPDVFYKQGEDVIIGEAKSFDDFGRDHSKAQYEEYIQFCEKYTGERVIVVAVPWQIVPEAKNYFILLKRKFSSSVKIIILNELGREAILE